MAADLAARNAQPEAGSIRSRPPWMNISVRLDAELAEDLRAAVPTLLLV